MKKAFTMMELIFVIVVIGILAAVVIPRTGSNKLNEAAIQVVSHIRYTQHLAMVDDKFDTGDSVWYKKRWQIVFSTDDSYADNKPSYSIFYDKDADGTVDQSELAKNNLDQSRYLTGGLTGYSALNITNPSTFIGTSALNIGKSYGITDITLSSSCSTGTKIAFDNLGRPLKGPLNTYTSAYPSTRLISAQCTITLTDGTDNVIIAIEPETGYACILNSAGTDCL
ncbi:MAG: prepilin-type N-terminal cleavage/methylation domain-containing protein [Sulfurimonas sp.]|jgi:prepilin-type N-terminal cleavage/methylation domain-containing protein